MQDNKVNVIITGFQNQSHSCLIELDIFLKSYI